MYSLSTCWNSHRHIDGRAMLREIRDLGFQYAELSHGIRISLLPGILEAVDAGEIRISSLHNFCPLPVGVTHAAPNLYQFSDPRDRERDLAFRLTLKTLDFAVRVKAPLVVLHLGSIEMRAYTDKLLEMVGRGEKESPKYQKLCMELEEKRESKKEPCFERVKAVLKKLQPEAARRNLMLGLENREALEELPIESDFNFLFRELGGTNLAYWHDVGHAQIKENLGFVQHTMLLETMRDRLFGMHIHDVQPPGHDHRAPGTGCVDFAALKPLLKPGLIKVFELSPKLSVEEVTKGVSYVRGLWGED
jgi:sugar phosphate isomerase/epimerase